MTPLYRIVMYRTDVQIWMVVNEESSMGCIIIHESKRPRSDQEACFSDYWKLPIHTHQ